MMAKKVVRPIYFTENSDFKSSCRRSSYESISEQSPLLPTQDDRKTFITPFNKKIVKHERFKKVLINDFNLNVHRVQK
jgi:hypothetical protein